MGHGRVVARGLQRPIRVHQTWANDSGAPMPSQIPTEGRERSRLQERIAVEK